jgi:TolB-like protein
MLLSLVLTSALLSAAEKPKLAVLELQPLGVPAETAAALTEAMTQELTRRGFFEVISSRDIQTLLGVERQKQLLGCSDDASSCITELAGALGSRFVLSGSLAKLGDALQLSVQMLDTQKGQPVARSVRLANDVDTLVAQLPFALAEATATPLPPPPSRWLPITLMAAGGAAVVAGAILGVDALSRDRALTADLAQPSDTGVFKPLTSYQAEADAIATQKTISLVTMISGAALVTLGLVLYPKDAARSGVTLVPTFSGFALVGVLP